MNKADLVRLIKEANDERSLRLYRYLAQAGDFVQRDQIMHWVGFPSPKQQPICAYVEFENAVTRLNALLHRKGLVVVRDCSQRERYAMVPR